MEISFSFRLTCPEDLAITPEPEASSEGSLQAGRNVLGNVDKPIPRWKLDLEICLGTLRVVPIFIMLALKQVKCKNEVESEQ